MTPQKLINPKALTAVIRDFFGRSQLSQFMDQINPLAELTHKRRLSALGPGGLSRDRAGFEVRDVHPSHYGRICPIETPEGPNIGLISSLCTFARINEFGFIETPYRKVENGRVTDQIDYLTADREENFIVAQANSPIDAKGHFTGEKVSVRYRGDFLDVEPAQGRLHGRFAEAAGLRRRGPDSVPRTRRREPRVDGFEHATPGRAAARHRSAARRHRPRRQRRPRFARRRRRERSRQRRLRHRPTRSSSPRTASCRKAARSSRPTRKTASTFTSCASSCARTPAPASTRSRSCKKGEHVKKGQVIADGPCTENGELALGRNVLVAFMPWNGYNFEDAILISREAS